MKNEKNGFQFLRSLLIAIFLVPLFSLSGISAWAQPAPQASYIHVYKAKGFARSAPIRSMGSPLVPPIVKRAEGGEKLSPEQLAGLEQGLISEGLLRGPNQAEPDKLLRKKPALEHAPLVKDPVLQHELPARINSALNYAIPRAVTSPSISFDGLGTSTGLTNYVSPPDTDIAVGMNYIAETVNTNNGGVYQIYDKSGNAIGAPVLLENLWATVGGPCADYGAGDNVVLYDQFAERFVITQMAGQDQFAGQVVPSDECIAVSETADPTGSYYVYDFPIFVNFTIDYQKIAVWPDAYYAAFNLFSKQASVGYVNMDFVAFDRKAILSGDPNAEVVAIQSTGNDYAYSLLPADVDGRMPPPAGTPGIFMDYISPYLWGRSTPYALAMWQMHVNWTNPYASTVTGPRLVDVAPFNDGICGNLAACIPEPPPAVSGDPDTLESLSDRLMYRLAYRNGVGTDGHQVLTVNQTVGAGTSAPPAGIRWYELDAPAGSTGLSQWTVGQQGTFAPNDGESRWMGSVAMDRSGDMALGYSVSSTSSAPAIAYTGRLASDPAGEMTEPETRLTNASTGTPDQRWGDYSSMMLDPTDGCTFWYAQEYYGSDGYHLWSTHIGAFKFSTCVPAQVGTLSGQITAAASGSALAGATVTIEPNDIVAQADSNGNYSVRLPTGSYTLAAGKFGYQQQSVSSAISSGAVDTQNFSLVRSTAATVSGTVTDSGHGYGLYAKVAVESPGVGQVASVWTDPNTGHYSVDLPTGSDYTFDTSAYLPGYLPATAAITNLSGATTENMPLTESVTCMSPGYKFGYGTDFDHGFPPSGWTVVNAVSGSPVVWRINTYWRQGNYTDWRDGKFTNVGGVAAMVDPVQDYINTGMGYQGPYDTSLITAPIPVSTLPASPILSFLLDGEVYVTGALDVDMSADGGATWTNLAHITGVHGLSYQAGGQLYQLPITIPNGTTSIEFRWRHHGQDAFHGGYMQIDNVGVGACQPIPGGIVTGRVTSISGGQGQSGAEVRDSQSPRQDTLAIEPPSGATTGAGAYWLFVPTPTDLMTKLTASAVGYAPASATVTVPSGGEVEHDFKLGAAQIAAAPSQIDIHVMVNNQVSDTLKVTNTGNAPGHYEFLSFDVPPPSTQPQPSIAAQGLITIHCSRRLSPLPPLTDSGVGGFIPSCSSEKTLANTRSASSTLSSAWQSIAPYPNEIMDNGAATDDATGKVYSLGGYSAVTWINSIYVYDPNVNTWSLLTGTPFLIAGPTLTVLDNQLYAAFGWADAINYGGKSGTGTTSINIYNLSTKKWTYSAPAPYAEGSGTAGVVLGDKIYYIGGCNGSVCGDTHVQIYDTATNTWTTAAPYPHPVDLEACGAIGGKIYCAGGVSGSGAYADGYVYDPATNSWSGIAPIPVGSGGLWGSSYSGSPAGLIIAGGVMDNSTTITNQTFLYNPSNNSWSSLANAPNAVYEGGSACGLYQIGGSVGLDWEPVANAARLTDLDPCTTSIIPWMSYSPASGTLAPGASASVTLTFNGSGETEDTISQAYLLLRGLTPYGPEHIPLTIHWDPLPIDLSVKATASTSQVSVNSPVSYSVQVTNISATNHGAAQNTVLIAQLPSNVTGATAGDPSSCANQGGGKFVCSLGTLGLGDSVTETFQATSPSQGGVIDSYFSTSAQEPDSDTSNNAATVSVDVRSPKSSPGSGGGGGGGGGDIGWITCLFLAALLLAGRKRIVGLDGKSANA